MIQAHALNTEAAEGRSCSQSWTFWVRGCRHNFCSPNKCNLRTRYNFGIFWCADTHAGTHVLLIHSEAAKHLTHHIQSHQYATAITSTRCCEMAERASDCCDLLSRKSCDGCVSKKLKCSGGRPCDRCAAEPDCTYSALRRTGRPCKVEDTPTSQGFERTDSRGLVFSGRSGQVSYRARFPDASVSSGTEISGLIPSRFLSAFVRHFLPM